MNKLICYSSEVKQALDDGRPIVAFETTILSFGLPYPANEQVGFLCERIVREAGATPATLAILDGRVVVGLTREEIRFFCSKPPNVMKVNLQNFPAALKARCPGALTVAASVKACAMAGLRVFATGGIGGVHRGFAQTLDISADLRALAQYPVVVVSAGAKSILDVGATLEALETLGVPVVGYRTQRFPLFFTAESPYELDLSFETVEEIAEFVRLHFATGGAGILVVTPVPQEHSVPLDELEQWIAQALREAESAKAAGKAVTPFLLRRLEELSGSRTVKANKALIANNAELAARLSCALANQGE